MFSRAEAKWFRKSQMWRKRVGVEPTIRLAKSRIAGFEGRDSPRTLFASAGIITADRGVAKPSNPAPSLPQNTDSCSAKEGRKEEGTNQNKLLRAQPFVAPTFLRANSSSLGWTHTSKYGRFVGPPIFPPVCNS